MSIDQLTTEQKRDFVGRALAFLNEAAGEGISFSTLNDDHDPQVILMELTEALGLDDWLDACEALLEQLS